MGNSTSTLTTYGPHNAPNKFYTARGRLTSYALACGYVEKHETPIFKTELYREGNCYHVRTFDSVRRVEWSVADTLTEAHQFMARHIRQHHLGAT